MASRKETTQLVTSFTIPRDDFLGKVVSKRNLKKKDYIVLLFLLTQLDGWNSMRRMIEGNRSADPLNFKNLHIGNMSLALGLEKSEIRASLKTLKHEGLIEEGTSSTVSKGYRLTF